MTSYKPFCIKPIRSVSAFTATALILGGCAVFPKHQTLPEIATPEHFATTQSFAAPVTNWPSDRWWNGFDDPQLTVLIEEGLAGATDVRIADARFARANALVTQTHSALLPSLSVNGQATDAKQSYNYIIPRAAIPEGVNDYGQVTIDLSWELDFWGRNRSALAAARSEAEAAHTEAAGTRLMVSTGIASAYADLVNLYAQLDAVQESVTVHVKTKELFHLRNIQGLENKGPVDRAEAALSQAKSEEIAIKEAINLTQNRIAALIGAGPDRGLSITRPAPMTHQDFGLPTNLPMELIGRRPDVIAARLRTEAAASRIKQARAAFYPNVNLMGFIGAQALGLNKLFISGSSFGAVGPAISLPIFEGGRLRGQYRGAEAEYQIAVAQYDGVLTQALREVADAATSQRALGERLSRAQASATAAEAAWQVANNRYQAGLSNYLDVLTAEDALIIARRNVASMKSRAFALDVALVRALGGAHS